MVHGLPGLKTHAKALLVVRREGSGVRHYVHIGTGNYHAKTARLYEDFGLFTCDREIGADVAELFNSLTGAARSPEYRKAVVAPGPHARLVPRRGREDHRGQARGRGRAHRAEDELARGRALHPRALRGLAGRRAGGPRTCAGSAACARACRACPRTSRSCRWSGRFLEHSRIYGFHRGDERHYWLGSPDLMPRNLDTRVELLAPVEAEPLRAQLEDTLERCLADDTFGWELGAGRRLDAPRRRHALGARELMERALEPARALAVAGPARASARARAPRSRGCASGRPGHAAPRPAGAGTRRSSSPSPSSGSGRLRP